MLGKKMRIALMILATVIVGLWLYTGSLITALLGLVLVPAIWPVL